MSKCTALFGLVDVLIFFNSVAEEKLVSFSSDIVSTWSPNGAEFTQSIYSLAPVTITMSAEAQSTFNITTTTTNQTWTGYILFLEPQSDATFVEGTAESTKSNTVPYPNAWTIEFRAPQEVLPGGVVTLEFDLSIPDDEIYTFALTQQPIPEPTTIVILGLGSLYLLRKRKGVQGQAYVLCPGQRPIAQAMERRRPHRVARRGAATPRQASTRMK